MDVLSVDSNFCASLEDVHCCSGKVVTVMEPCWSRLVYALWLWIRDSPLQFQAISNVGV